MTNRDKAEQYFVENGLMPRKEDRTERWHLHHKDPTLKYRDPERYDEWRIEDLQPMTMSEHTTIHNTGRVVSMETRQKTSSTMKGRPNWSKGRTKENDWRVAKRAESAVGRVSPTKGTKVSEETRKKMSTSAKNRKPRRWKLVDGKHVYY